MRRPQQQRPHACQGHLNHDACCETLVPRAQLPARVAVASTGHQACFFDVDGVLTDGGLYFSEQGETLKRFSTLDGHGLKLLMQAGITPVVITGRDSLPLRKRLTALGIKHATFGTEDKLPVAQSYLRSLGLDWSQTAAMGDDWPDLPVMQHAAFACAPANAHAQALAIAQHITSQRGGDGAARAFCDLLLVAGGHYAKLLARVTSNTER